MAEAQTFSNPNTGQEIRVLRFDPEALVVESLLPPASPQPPPHFHPTQHEHFEVLEGEVATKIGAEERVYRKGERFEVPAGVVHEMSNRASDTRARLRWETRPAQKTLEFFETVGRIWQGDQEALSDLGRFSDEIRFPEP